MLLVTLVVAIGSLEELNIRLGALAASAQQQQQGGSRAATNGSGVGGGTSPARPGEVLDLGGRQLGGGEGQVLVVPPGVRCTIRNGTLLVCVVVREAANVSFVGVNFNSWPGRVAGGERGVTVPASDAVPAVVTVHGLKAGAQLHECTVKAQGESPGTYACVTACGGGRVQMHGGTLTGAGLGLLVDSGSSGEATGTVAEGCAGTGFSALGPGAVLELRGCTARGNGGDGVGSYKGGRTVLAAGNHGTPCRAEGNKGCGMRSTGAGSVLVARKCTLSSGNGKGGLGASDRGRLEVGDEIIIADNGEDGMCA